MDWLLRPRRRYMKAARYFSDLAGIRCAYYRRMNSKCFSASYNGLKGITVEVEGMRQASIPAMVVTGLPGEVIKESRERVRGCLQSLGYSIPSARVVVHLSPAMAKKQGSQLDLAICIAVLAAEEKLAPEKICRFAFIGEVTLDGRVRRVERILALIDILEKDSRVEFIILSTENEKEAHLLGSSKTRFVRHLSELIEHFRDQRPLSLVQISVSESDNPPRKPAADWEGIRGMATAKRALEIALAGRHHFLMAGAPGTGKSLLSSQSVALLPPLTNPEFIELSRVYDLSPSNGSESLQKKWRPFRSPHHQSPAAAVLGGGSGTLFPGEVSLAHQGILFLDELPEFRRDVLEALREPMQEGKVSLSRIGINHTLPARFTLIAAMNPCPCGYAWEERISCSCSPEKIRQYQKRISGPLLDRFSLFAKTNTPKSHVNLRDTKSANEITESILRAWTRQQLRFHTHPPGTRNGDVMVLDTFCDFNLPPEALEWMHALDEGEIMSSRHRTQLIRTARTIADLADADKIYLEHLEEAWSLRCPRSFQPFAC